MSMKLSSPKPRLLENASPQSVDHSVETNSVIRKPLHHEEPEIGADEDVHVHPKETVQRILGINHPLRQPVTKHCDENVENYTMRLVRAVRSSNTKELREMLNDDRENDCGDVSFEACNNQGESLLHLACRRSNLDTMRFLVLDAGVDVHVRDDMGRSILHDLFWRPEPATEHLELLLSIMDPSFLLLEDSRGHTPLDYSRQENWKEWNAFFHSRKPLLQKGTQRDLTDIIE